MSNSSVSIIACAYAHAIFNIAKEKENIEQWKLMLKLFVRVSSYELVRSLFFRFLEPERLSNIFVAICEDFQEKRVDAIFVNFIRVISEKNRFLLLPMIFEEFDYLYYMHYKRILKIEVISAFPLSDKQRKSIVSILTNFFDRKIDIVNKFNKNIFAGMIIRIGDTVFDASVYRRILRLKNYLLRS